MISARKILAQWCEINLPRFDFDKVEFTSISPDQRLDKAGLGIEHWNFVASFTAWGEEGMTEWLIMDARSGETIVNRDEEFSDAKQLEMLVEKALMDFQRLGLSPNN
jgi:hypothetical protein